MLPKSDKVLSEKFMQMLFVVHYNFFRKTTIPIPANHFGVLLVLRDLGPATISEISLYLCMSKQQMTPIINKLVKSSLLSRTTPPEDRHCTLLDLTEKGKAILIGHNEQVRQLFETGLSKLPPKEATSFGNSMDIFISGIKRMFPLPETKDKEQ